MQYSPKLKKLMQRLKLIINAENVGATVILHDPTGFSEFYLKVDPNYSCAKVQDDGSIRIRAKLEDYKGSKALRDKALTDTVNMIQHLADTNAQTSLMMYQVLDQLKKVIDIEQSGGNMTDHTTQNN